MARQLGYRGRTRARALAVLVSLLLALPPGLTAWAEGDQAANPFPPEQIEQLVAPIALYPDSLLAQVLMASTYPMEVVEAARWQQANPSVKDKALDDALLQQTWDPSVKSLVSFPQVLTMMNEKLDWTQQLGDAFLAQQSDVMDAVQRLRARAQAQGSLQTSKEQTVVVQQPPADAPAGSPPVIVIQPTNPQVVYVPTYNPTVAYGSWPYPSYPPTSYYPPGYSAAAMATTSALSFGAGMAVGGALWGGCNWGWGHGHGGVDVDVNRYNNFNRNSTRNYSNISGNNNQWQHDPAHRKGAQYRDKGTQERFNKGGPPGADSREAFRGRADEGRQQIAREGTGNVQRDLAKPGGNAGGKVGGADRSAKGAERPSQGAERSAKPAASAQRSAGGGSAGAVAANRGSGAKSSGKGSGAFQDVGNGGQARKDSARGNASRQSAASVKSKAPAKAPASRAGGGGSHGGGGGGSHGGGGGGGHGGGGGGGRRK